MRLTEDVKKYLRSDTSIQRIKGTLQEAKDAIDKVTISFAKVEREIKNIRDKRSLLKAAKDIEQYKSIVEKEIEPLYSQLVAQIKDLIQVIDTGSSEEDQSKGGRP